MTCKGESIIPSLYPPFARSTLSSIKQNSRKHTEFNSLLVFYFQVDPPNSLLLVFLTSHRLRVGRFFLSSVFWPTSARGIMQLKVDQRVIMSDVLKQLADVLEQRKQQTPDQSYVASLYAKGLDQILKKIGEEATETVMAAKDGQADKIVYEVADLWFHSMVLLAHQNLGPELVLNELQRRFGLSGHQEKAQRATSD